MPITFSCTHCQSKMTVPENFAGKSGKCKKCNNVITVPAAGVTPASVGKQAVAESPPSPSGKPAATRVTSSVSSPTPAPKPVIPDPPPAGSMPDVDLEATAAEMLSDGPKEKEKELDAVEFTCPQCDEPIKLPLNLAGKRAPCPVCSRIIPVPVPQKIKEKNWRDTGPNLPAGAKRDIGPDLDGAWGTGKVAGLSQEAAEEAGLIPEKERPLTFYQRYQMPILVGVPTLLLLIVGYYAWNWYAAGREARSYNSALNFANSDAAKTVGSVAIAGLYTEAGRYQSRTKPEGAGNRAKEKYAEAEKMLRGVRGPIRDALLADLARAAVALGGEGDELVGDSRVKWDEAQKLTRQALTPIETPEVRIAGLRAVAAHLVRRGQVERATVLPAQISGTDAERAEALSVVGLELLRAGKKEVAEKLAKEAESVYAVAKEATKTKDNRTRPPLRAAVVSLAVALEHNPPEPGNNLAEKEAATFGRIAGLALAGKLDDARAAAGRAEGNAARLVAAIGLVSACEKPTADDLTAAMARLKEAPDRRGLDWELLRLLETALRADAKPDEIEAIVAVVPTPILREWGQLVVIRDRAARTRSAIPMTEVEKINAKSPVGLLARLEAARQNTWVDAGWAATVGSWDESSRAFGSLGVALGLQGVREER